MFVLILPKWKQLEALRLYEGNRRLIACDILFFSSLVACTIMTMSPAFSREDQEVHLFFFDWNDHFWSAMNTNLYIYICIAYIDFR